MKNEKIKLANFVYICIIFMLSNSACNESNEIAQNSQRVTPKHRNQGSVIARNGSPIKAFADYKQQNAGLSEQSPNIEETISELVAALRKGDFEIAKTKFAPSSKSDILDNLDSKGANQLADWIENGKIIRDKPRYKAYKSEWIDENGNKHHVEFIFSLNSSGDWVIISW